MAIIIAACVVVYRRLSPPWLPTLAAFLGVWFGGFMFWQDLPAPGMIYDHWRDDMVIFSESLLLFWMYRSRLERYFKVRFDVLWQYLGAVAAFPLVIIIGQLESRRHAVEAIAFIMLPVALAALLVTWRVRVSRAPVLAVALLYLARYFASIEIRDADGQRGGHPAHGLSRADWLQLSMLVSSWLLGIMYHRQIRLTRASETTLGSSFTTD
jgi:hypothetical protein